MRKISPNKAHFFQPLLPDYLYNFSIPKSFLINLGDLQSKQEKKAELRDKKGRSWYVKLVMSSIGDNNSSRPQFKDGWESFCKVHDLQVGDFLVFKHQGNFVFDVLIFAPTACERQLPISNPTLEKNVTNPNVNNSNVAKKLKGEEFKMGDEEDIMKGRTISTSKSSSYPSCHTVVKSYCLTSKAIFLPKEFTENNGLSRRWCDMELIDEKGRSWTVHLRYRRERKSGSPSYIGSWKRFHQANDLKNGDAVIFQLIDSGAKPVMKFYKI